MYSFEHKDTENHPVKDTSIVLEDVAHRAKDCLEQLLEVNVAGTVNTHSATCVG